MSNRPLYLDALARGVVIFDGAMGTSLDTFTLTAQDFGGKQFEGARDYLVLQRPDIIEQIHRSFLEAGADALETCTFQSTRLRLEEWGLAHETYALNVAAAALARRLCDEFTAQDGRPRFVAGSMGPTGRLPSSSDPVLSDIAFEALVETFREQAAALIDGGADLLLIETTQDILELKAAVIGSHAAIRAAGRPIALQAQITLDVSGRMLLGTDIAAALTTIEALGVDVVGLNCSTGPEHMREPIRYLTAHSRLPVSCIPNAGLPLNLNGQAVYPLEPLPLARTLSEFVHQLGVRVVGGCCGTTPEHIRALVTALRGSQSPLAELPVPADTSASEIGYVSSGMRAVPLQVQPGPLIVGERVNSLGSRKVKRLLLKDDYEGVLEVAREQVDAGAHVLDVCVAMTERSDEAEMMVRLVRLLAQSVEPPLMFDSTETEVLEAALQHYPGRPILNSTSLEGGRERKLDKTLSLARRYGAAVIAMAIDEGGMAHTPEHKLEVCRRIFEIATREYGLPAHALIFDVNTFPITTGQEELRNSAAATIEGIRLVKQQLPGALSSLGVSNLSFGVAEHARGALNSVFLFHAVNAGLDLAMVNPAHITPYAEIPAEARLVCEDLIFNRREDALARFIAFFEVNSSARADDAREDPTAGMNVDQRLHWQILHRKKEGVEALIDAAIAERATYETSRGLAAVDILNNVLLPAMKEVGDKFGAGELILPFVLQSAEVMKKTVAHLEQYLDKQEGVSKGKVVLATVYGDVHDIGKSLVNTILSNNGYTVFDLGKQVPINTIIEKAVEVQADAIGLSALLVSTSKQMPLCVQELDKRGLHIPVLIGGAAINRQYGLRSSFVEAERQYSAGVFYCKDAFEGLETVDKLTSPAIRSAFVSALHQEAREALKKPQTGRVVMTELGRATGSNLRSNVSANLPVPAPPFWGAQATRRIRLDDIFAHLDRNTLYRLQWGARNARGAEWERLQAEFDLRLLQLRREAEREGWLEPAVVYGYFPVQSSGQELIVYDPAERSRELTRFVFPRQPKGELLCLADYFRSVESGEYDVATFQLVTMGDKITELCDRLQREGDYSRGYFIHGLGVTLAEALAEYTNRIVRQSLGLQADQGRRYSWGYPACPDLEEHTKLFELLPTERIGVTLSSAFQLIPEQSTAAIVVHHPEAKYFSIGSVRERAEQDTLV